MCGYVEVLCFYAEEGESVRKMMQFGESHAQSSGQTASRVRSVGEEQAIPGTTHVRVGRVQSEMDESGLRSAVVQVLMYCSPCLTLTAIYLFCGLAVCRVQ